jgi:predicted AlkP superfamily pyrophosphatase or phosphodiesterase
MKRGLGLIGGLILFFACDAPAKEFNQNNEDRPKLVVGLVVDQIRQEYLYRFYPHFVEGGFKRLMNEGFHGKNAHFNYIPTYTGPGHASVYTGTTPQVHGVIGNDFYSPQLKRMVYCAEDTTVINLGGTIRNGKISPKNLLSSTISDELKLFSSHRAKVIGISVKDRGAALPAGFLANGAYWYDSQNGEMMSSTWYFEDLPKWVKDFNAKRMPDQYLSNTWNTLLPIAQYLESGPDERPYERKLGGLDTSTFPYDLTAMKANAGYSVLPNTPWGNTLLIDFAKAAIEAENLGNGEFTDLLAISFSSTDYIGHAFGAYSKEIQDTYVRLDRELAAFFEYLDEKVGKGEYLVFLTADHAVANVPQHMLDLKMSAGYSNSRGISSILKDKMNQKFGEGDWILNVSNDQVFLNTELIKSRNRNILEMENFLASELMELPGITGAFTRTQLISGLKMEGQADLVLQGFNQRRSGNIAYVFQPNWIDGGYGRVGTTHGSGWNYDTHVPILFYGWGIKPGSTVDRLSITDIAPTLSVLLKIGLPNGATGSPIKAIFE